MISVSNILVLVDPTAAIHPAIDKAVRIAAKCNARMELFACETNASRHARYAAHLAKGQGHEFTANLRAILDTLAQPARELGIDVCIETDSGDPLHVRLLERTQRTSADLVVKDTHHHSLAKRTFLTNTDWQLIRGCPVPLLLTKQHSWQALPPVAAAVDPGHVNDKPEILDQCVLDWTRWLTLQLGGSMHLVHAFLPLLLTAEAAAGTPAMTTLLTAQMLEELRAAKQSQLQALARAYEIGAANLHLDPGVASEVLPRVAQHIGADIVVMGAISRSGLQRLFIGSTAERVLETIPCDVLVVKPPDFAAMLPF